MSTILIKPLYFSLKKQKKIKYCDLFIYSCLVTRFQPTMWFVVHVLDQVCLFPATLTIRDNKGEIKSRSNTIVNKMHQQLWFLINVIHKIQN